MLFLFIIVFFFSLFMNDEFAFAFMYIYNSSGEQYPHWLFFFSVVEICIGYFGIRRYFMILKKNTALGSRAVFCLEGLPMKNVL